MKKILPIGLALTLSACTFNNSSGQFALDLNQFDKQQAPSASITGTYRTKAVSSDRFEQMQIKAIGKGFYQVTINSPKTPNGCTFSGKAPISNGQLRLPLSAVNPKLNSVMSITFTGNKAVVDTTQPEHFNDLKTFCGSGSLVGGYYKY
ncbi:MAG: hypothetical protein KGV56_01955 [Gammaproteobacteria bacterium]|nr:hypothetical protein [Gammaproteobacteria bacterium]